MSVSFRIVDADLTVNAQLVVQQSVFDGTPYVYVSLCRLPRILHRHQHQHSIVFVRVCMRSSVLDALFSFNLFWRVLEVHDWKYDPWMGLARDEKTHTLTFECV